MKSLPYLPDESSCLQLYNDYRRNAASRHIKFDIPFPLFIAITKSDCFYCGKKAAQKRKKRNAPKPYIYNGLDRISSKRPYILNNVVPACFPCNGMKKRLTVREFFARVKRIADFNKL